MGIILKGETGYYSREVTIDGSKLKIRELTDDELSLAMGKIDSVRSAAGLSSTVQNEDVIEAVQGIVDSSAGKQLEMLNIVKDAVEYVACCGIVSWDLQGVECTPENVKRLPNMVLARVMREIMADSTLSAGEESFLAR